MPVFSAPIAHKILVLNEEKNRGVVVEFPNDMTLEELVTKLNELIVELNKSIEKQKKEKEEKTNSKIEEVSEEQFKQAIEKAEIVDIED